MLWRFVRHRINNLDKRFEVAQDALYRMLYGREETPPRKTFCVSYVNGNLGNIVGSMFVRRHFDQQSKKDVSGDKRCWWCDVNAVFAFHRWKP